MEALACLGRLRRLQLWGAPITDRGVEALVAGTPLPLAVAPAPAHATLLPAHAPPTIPAPALAAAAAAAAAVEDAGDAEAGRASGEVREGRDFFAHLSCAPRSTSLHQLPHRRSSAG